MGRNDNHELPLQNAWAGAGANGRTPDMGLLACHFGEVAHPDDEVQRHDPLRRRFRDIEEFSAEEAVSLGWDFGDYLTSDHHEPISSSPRKEEYEPDHINWVSHWDYPKEIGRPTDAELMDAQHVQVVIRRRQEADNGKGCRRGPNGNHGQNLPPQMKLHKPMPGTKRRRNGTHSYESHCPKPKRLKGSSTVKRLPILKEKDEATA